MGMIMYHKLTAEITGPDGRGWIVSVEPPLKAAPEGEATKYEVELRRDLPNWPEAYEGAEPLKYTVPSPDGMFKALSMALDLVPRWQGND